MEIYRNQTGKPIRQFVLDVDHAARRRGFVIHNEDRMDMAGIFHRHGIPVAGDFDLHMLHLCKPEKAARSLLKNPERAVLMPKFIVAFSRAGVTQIRCLRYRPETVASLLDDAEFPDSLAAGIDEIIAIIEEAAATPQPLKT
jgi:hypothetical protein